MACKRSAVRSRLAPPTPRTLRFAGKERRVSLGVYPEVGLKEARQRLEQARKLVAGGIDPSAQRQAAKRALTEGCDDSFEALGREWFKLNESKWVPTHASKIIGRLERDLFIWPLFFKQPASNPRGTTIILHLADE